jgi:hypothetical protein
VNNYLGHDVLPPMWCMHDRPGLGWGCGAHRQLEPSTHHIAIQYKYVPWQAQVSLSRRVRTVDCRATGIGTFTAIHKFNSWTSERGALLGVGGCVDTRGLAAQRLPIRHRSYTSKPELVHLSLSISAEAGRQRFAGAARALRPAGPADFHGAVRGLTTARRRCGSQCPCVLQLNVGSPTLPSATVGCDQGWRTRARVRQQWCGACPGLTASRRPLSDHPSCLLCLSESTLAVAVLKAIHSCLRRSIVN